MKSSRTAKLHLHSKSELVRYAIRNRIIEHLKSAPQDVHNGL